MGQKKRVISRDIGDSEFLAVLGGAFVLAVLCVFPVLYHDYYYDILEFKCLSYTVLAALFLGLSFVYLSLRLIRDVKTGGGMAAGRFMDAVSPWHWNRQPVHIRLLLVFWILTLSSTVCSAWPKEAWTGSEGRYSGMIMISFYVLTTLLTANFGDVRRGFLDAFLSVSLFVAVFGITDYFRMDILGFKAMEAGNPAADIFYSTMGNVNTYTAFLALPAGAAAALFAVETVLWKRILYFAAAFVFYVALFTGQSDNSYLALAALFCALPFFLWRNRRGLASYVLLLAGFGSAVLLAGWWKEAYADIVIWYSGIIDVLMKVPFFKGITALLWICGAGLTVWDARGKQEEPAEQRAFAMLRRSWGVFLIACFLIVVFVLFDANAGGHPERYEAVHNYVVFSDDWGVQRGFAWRIGWQEYKELPFFRKVLGSGPDTYGLLTESHWQEGIDKYGFYYESAHNEYFQYFVTIGPFATLAYVGFLAAALWKMAKCAGMTHMSEPESGDDRRWLLAPFMGVLCYAAQAVVNISIPIAAAVMWALMACGLAGCRTRE